MPYKLQSKNVSEGTEGDRSSHMAPRLIPMNITPRVPSKLGIMEEGVSDAMAEYHGRS